MTTNQRAPALPVWHAGEVAMQRRAGSARRLEELGTQIMRDHLIQQHRDFYAALPFVVLGTVDAQGDVWASVRANRPGFLHAPDASILRVNLARDAQDPGDGGIEAGEAIGLLGLAPISRRRNRLNGEVLGRDADSFDIGVAQSFGNCPQYIHQRELRFVRDPAIPSQFGAMRMQQLQGRALQLVQGADTLFVASYTDHEEGVRQVDVSHRGGKAGFVRVNEQGVLSIPDYRGNQFFNTFGNFVANPRAGVVFVDFATGDLLQMSGDVEVILDSPEIAGFEYAERLWRFRPRHIVWRERALALNRVAAA